MLHYDHPDPQHIRYERVRSIVPGPTVPVYDLTVEGSETFIAEGFAVHNTRWHHDDLAGRLMAEVRKGDGEDWVFVNLPAIAEEEGDAMGRHVGEALWPTRWPIEELEETKRAIGSRPFSAQYQCRPIVAGDRIVNSDDLVRIKPNEVPPLKSIVRSWDLAFAENQGSDYTCGFKCGLDDANNFYILSRTRIQGRWPIVKPKIVQASIEDGARVTVSVEGNGVQKGYYDDLRAEVGMRGRRVLRYQPSGTKEERAEVWGSRLPDGIVYLVEGAWNGELIDEMDQFPAGAHDDQVDSISQAWAMLFRWAKKSNSAPHVQSLPNNSTEAPAPVAEYTPMKYDNGLIVAPIGGTQREKPWWE